MAARRTLSPPGAVGALSALSVLLAIPTVEAVAKASIIPTLAAWLLADTSRWTRGLRWPPAGPAFAAMKADCIAAETPPVADLARAVHA